LNKWYTVKVEFCTDPANRYSKWTLLDDMGNIIDCQARAALYSSYQNVIPSNTEAIIKSIYFWNDGNSGNIHIDDITLKEVTPSELVIENFASDFRDSNLWVNNTHGTIANGVMTIEAGKYPYIKLPDSLNVEKAYKFSYKIMGTTRCNASDTEKYALFKPYSDVGGANFVGYRPGQGFTCVGNDWTDSFKVTGPEYEKLNEWYMVEVEFCQSTTIGYSKWTIKDSAGKILYSKKINGGLKKYTDGEGFVTQNLAGSKICLWNNMSDAPVVIDDIKISQISGTISDTVLLDETFDVEDITALKNNGNGWRGNDGGIVTVENNELQLHSGAWIYFDIPQKTNVDAYRVSYDIKMTGVTGTERINGVIPNTALVATGGYLLGVYNPLLGLCPHKLDFSPQYTIPVSEANGKWYTVSVEFSENADISFMKCTLTDRESGQIVGVYNHPYLESDTSNAMVTNNSTSFYFWNRGGEGSIAYIDNVKFEKIDISLDINVNTDIVAKDCFGNDVKLGDGVTPALTDIYMTFTDYVTQESAESSIMLREKDGEEVLSNVSVVGKTVILNLEKLLKVGTTYELLINDTVSTAAGITLKGPVMIEFTTGTPPVVDAINVPAANLSELIPNGVLTIEVVSGNFTSIDKKATVISTFYSDTGLESVQIFDPVMVPAGEVNNWTVDINVPEDLSQIVLMKVFLWNDLTEMRPYLDSVELLPE